MSRSRPAFFVTLLFFSLGTVTSVGSQRKRLPPPADCTDPVVGIWKSHNYAADHSHWTQFTAEIERIDGTDELRGRIVNHSWDGGPELEQPPECEFTPRRYVVSMDAQGTVRDGKIEFWGIGKWRMDELICGLPDFGYNLDHFTGTIEPELQEFQSVNNDGGIAVNEPTVFRRVKCYNDKEPATPVDPPPFQPPGAFDRPSLGCSLW